MVVVGNAFFLLDEKIFINICMIWQNKCILYRKHDTEETDNGLQSIRTQNILVWCKESMKKKITKQQGANGEPCYSEVPLSSSRYQSCFSLNKVILLHPFFTVLIIIQTS